MLFGNTPQLEQPVGTQSRNVCKESSDSNSVDVEDNVISDIEVTEIPSEFLKEKWSRKWKYLKTS